MLQAVEWPGRAAGEREATVIIAPRIMSWSRRTRIGRTAMIIGTKLGPALADRAARLGLGPGRCGDAGEQAAATHWQALRLQVTVLASQLEFQVVSSCPCDMNASGGKGVQT